jgi:transposase
VDNGQTGGRIEPRKVTRNGRRYFSREHKLAVVQACLEPGASVAGVALAYGFNANLVRRWLVQHRAREASAGVRLLPVEVRTEMPPAPPPVTDALVAREPASAAVEPVPEGVIELEVSGIRLAVHGRVDEAALGRVLQAMAHWR